LRNKGLPIPVKIASKIVTARSLNYGHGRHVEKFVQGDRLKSSIFPELELTAEAIFSATSIT
jgi:hypothetical protein